MLRRLIPSAKLGAQYAVESERVRIRGRRYERRL
jgi:hypothetical protein